MNILTPLFALLLLGIGAAVLIVLLSTEGGEHVESHDAFAFLPVPEDTPSVRAHLEYYASQVAWMDTSLLRCVILISTPQTHALCEELSRDYECFRHMEYAEFQQFLRERCGIR